MASSNIYTPNKANLQKWVNVLMAKKYGLHRVPTQDY